MTTPLIIAELGSNWNPDDPLGSIGAMMDAAKEAGADAVKLQDWHPIEDMNRSDEWKERCGPWTLGEYMTTLDLIIYGREKRGMEVFASPFTRNAVYQWNGRPLAKVASSELTNIELLGKLTGRRVMLSIGEAPHVNAIHTAIAYLAPQHITLMACVSEYPVKRHLDLADSLILAQTFGLPTGVSSHLTYKDALAILPHCVHTKGAEVVEMHLRVEGVTPESAPDNGPWALWPGEFAEVVKRLK